MHNFVVVYKNFGPIVDSFIRSSKSILHFCIQSIILKIYF